MAEIFLPIDSQRRLIDIARCALEDFVRGHPRRVVAHPDPRLETHDYGAFVTLWKIDQLRGCIGTCTPPGPLRDTVVDMTVAAASRDPRVKPISAGELEEIHIDISVLSKLLPAINPLALVIGEHGLHVRRGGKRGVLLPQVAVEQKWQIKTFLEQACAKANLPVDAWNWPDTAISSFTALVIEEEK